MIEDICVQAILEFRAEYSYPAVLKSIEDPQ